MSTFAITGHGRSGSKWLAILMNRSPSWEVQHEAGDKGLTRRHVAQDRFDRAQSDYGEVNGHLRSCIYDLVDIDQMGVIVRDPIEIFLSHLSKYPTYSTYEAMDLQFEGFRSVDRLLAAGLHPISFRRMTTEVAYTQDLLHRFGIDDVQVIVADLARKVNEGSKKYTSLDCHLGTKESAFVRMCLKRFKEMWSEFL